jgi:hypothetical protein
MPYGLRWICKTLSELIFQTNPNISRVEHNNMLATFLFYKWWLPSILSADMNGLLSNSVISDAARRNLSFIGNVIRKVIRNDKFTEP